MFAGTKFKPLHTVGSVPEAANILPSRVTVAASAASNWNPEYALPLNGIGGGSYLDSVFMTNGAGPSPTSCQPFLKDTLREEASYIVTEPQHFHLEQHSIETNVRVTTNSIGQNIFDFPAVQNSKEHESDKRLTVIQRALDFIEHICVNRHVEELWSVLLLQRKLSDVREYLLSETNETSTAATATTPHRKGTSDTSKLIDEIDQRINALSATIDSSTAVNPKTNHDSMGFDLFNRIRHWFLLGGRNNAKDPPKSQGEDCEQNRKRSCQSVGNEDAAQRLIKYRRVDNTFPKYMPNEAEDYSHMTEPNQQQQRREQDNNSNQISYQQTAADNRKRLSMFCTPQTRQVRVKNPQPTVAIDLSDAEEYNESILYQTFSDRLATGTQPEYERNNAATTTAGQGAGVGGAAGTTTNRPNMLYSDAVRYGKNGFVADLNYRRPSSSLSSSEPRLNGHGSLNMYESSMSNRDNVLVLEDQRSDHNQYINLINNLTVHDQERPRINRSVSASTTVAAAAGAREHSDQKPIPPKPPRLQPITPIVNGEDWMFALMAKRNREARVNDAIEREEFAKLLEKGTKHQLEQQTPMVVKKPPELVQCYSIHSNTSNIRTSSSSNDNRSKLTTVKNLTDDHIGRYANKSKMTPKTQALQLRHSTSIYFSDNYPQFFKDKCSRTQQETSHAKQLVLNEAEKTTEERRNYEQELRENLAKLRFKTQTLFVLEKYSPPEESEPEFLPFTEEHHRRYNELIMGPAQQVLISKFSLNITRTDIRTLTGSCWLNDEIINFYMNLLTDRSQRKEGKLPSVYAMNTFFVPRLLQNGHGAVKRWTRKVDIFSKDIIPVPVHVGGVHWCMAIIHMKNKTIRYYDSMGKPNQVVLNALEMYLRAESLDKRQKPFDTSEFSIENVQNVPQQTNGSDCGVFSCMFAEYISRNKPLTFSQDHMEYFRRKMVLEICSGELWM